MKTIMIVLVLFAFVKGPELYEKSMDNKHRNIKKIIVDTYNNPLEKVGIRFPNVVASQIALETRWLTSEIYKDNGNMFGMKESSRTWDVGSKHGHANYRTSIYYTHLDIIKPELRSLMDYKDWQEMRFNQARKRGMRIPETDEEYIYFLQHLPGGGSYAEDPNYADKIRRIINL